MLDYKIVAKYLSFEESKLSSTTKTLQTRRHLELSDILHVVPNIVSLVSNAPRLRSKLCKMAHHQKRGKKLDEEKQGEDDEEDPYDVRIKKSGCSEFHFALQVSLGSLAVFLELSKSWNMISQVHQSLRENHL